MRPAAPPRLLNDDEMLHIGLEQVGFDLYRQNSVSRATNVLRFVSHYGSTPLVCAAVWEDLITTEIPEAKIAAGTAPDKFFLGMYFLKVYPTEEKLAACFKVCEKAARKWAWIFACKIQALKAKKVSCYSSSELHHYARTLIVAQIVWPETWTNDHANNDTLPSFLYSVDGVHCRINEAKHPTHAKNAKLFSHKFNQAGVGYELAISVFHNSLVWMNGPFVGSKHDVTIFRNDGLKDRTPIGKRGIADNGISGERNTQHSEFA
jgi:hypothetical protein